MAFVAQIFHLLGKIEHLAKKMWCGPCYIPHSDDSFPVRLPVDDDGKVWIKTGDEDRFNVGHDGARLFLSFQCDIFGLGI